QWDWSEMRLLIGAGSETPTWPEPHDTPRILVEGNAPRWRDAETAQTARVQVLTCPGPAARRTPCPALAARRCPLAAQADAIVVSHESPDAVVAGLVDAHRQLHPGVPLAIEDSNSVRDDEIEQADERRERAVAFVQDRADQCGRAGPNRDNRNAPDT